MSTNNAAHTALRSFRPATERATFPSETTRTSSRPQTTCEARDGVESGCVALFTERTPARCTGSTPLLP
eukprot:scaffold13838_cov67-Phaeocystis_antarctica.AAC.1